MKKLWLILVGVLILVFISAVSIEMYNYTGSGLMYKINYSKLQATNITANYFYGNGMYITNLTETESRWTNNYSLFNNSWSNTFNSTVNTSINNYIVSANSSLANWVDLFFPRITELVGLVGNWTLDKVNYYNKTDINNFNASYLNMTNNSYLRIVDWNATNTSYMTGDNFTIQNTSMKNYVDSQNTSQTNDMNSRNLSITNSISSNNQSITNTFNLYTLISTLVDRVGNWTLDKVNYYTNTQVNNINTSQTNYGNWQNNSVTNSITANNNSVNSYISSNNQSVVNHINLNNNSMNNYVNYNFYNKSANIDATDYNISADYFIGDASFLTNRTPFVTVARDGTGDYNCNATEDCSIKIQQAVDYLHTTDDGGTIYIKKGIYKIYNPILLQDKSTLTIKGDGIGWSGGGTQLKVENNTNVFVLSGYFLTFEDFSIDYMKNQTEMSFWNGSGIVAKNWSTDCMVYNVFFAYMNEPAIFLNGTQTHGWRIRDNWFEWGTEGTNPYSVRGQAIVINSDVVEDIDISGGRFHIIY